MDVAVARDLADVGDGHALAGAERGEEGDGVGAEEEGVGLLVLGPPDLEDAQGGVADDDLADVDLAPRGGDDLLEHVAVAAGALVVDGDDGVGGAELAAGADDAVHLLLHLGVAALDGVEVELRLVVPLGHARRR